MSTKAQITGQPIETAIGPPFCHANGEGGEGPGEDRDDRERDREVGEPGPGARQLLLVAELGELAARPLLPRRGPRPGAGRRRRGAQLPSPSYLLRSLSGDRVGNNGLMIRPMSKPTICRPADACQPLFPAAGRVWETTCSLRSRSSARAWSEPRRALELARRGASVTLLEAEPDPGLQASGTNSGILHTGFDSIPGELETELILRAGKLRDPVLEALGVPAIRCGAVMRPAGRATSGRSRPWPQRDPQRGPGDLARRTARSRCPGESITDPVAFTLALAAAAAAPRRRAPHRVSGRAL